MKAPFRPALLAMTVAALVSAPWQSVMGGGDYRNMPVSAVVSPSISVSTFTLAPGAAEAFVASRSDAGDAAMSASAIATVRRDDQVSGASVVSVNLKRLKPEVVVEFAADVAAFAAAEVSAESSWLAEDRFTMQWNPDEVRTVLDRVAVTVLRYKLKNSNGSQPANLALPVLVTVSL